MSYEGVYEFYRDRVLSCPSYGFKSGHEILTVIMRTALRDSMLTDEEYNNIIDLCEKAHIKMMEDNYNGNWNQ